MGMFLELHIIQNFAPSNLNRDDTGAPKDALFGGVRRARVSSQCFKRSVRNVVKEHGLIDPKHLGVRTKKLKEILLGKLSDKDLDLAGKKIDALIAAAGLKLKEGDKTEYLLFLGDAEIAAMADMINQRWDELHVPESSSSGEKKSKKEGKASVPPDLAKAVKALLDGGKAVDVALFGRMLADLPAANQDAACQVAHAISTHRVDRDFDYFTAVDDKGDEDETGAGMLGQVEFNSATFYRYAALDVKKLFENLHKDEALFGAAIEAFVRAFAMAVPSGKQNSFAAQNLPEFIGITLRHAVPMSLANAFEKPIMAGRDQSLTHKSVKGMAEYENKLATVYGSGKDQWLYVDLTEAWPTDKGQKMSSLVEIAQAARKLVDSSLGG